MPLGVTFKVEYSTDDSSFTECNAAGDFDYANGQATEGDSVTGIKLTGPDTNGQYVESSGGAGTFDYAANNLVELADVTAKAFGYNGVTVY